MAHRTLRRCGGQDRGWSADAVRLLDERDKP